MTGNKRRVAFIVALLSALPARGDEPVALKVTAVPQALRDGWKLDPFYTKHVDAKGFPVLGSNNVTDHALLEAAYLVNQMLACREDIREALINNKVRLAVMAATEFTTDTPEHHDLKPPQYWNKRARGLGASRARPAVSCGEENLLNYPGDPYVGENILIHEFSHAIHQMGLRDLDKTFDGRLGAAYDEAIRQGIWKGTYAASNRAEYWAEGVQSWFDCNRKNDPQHNAIATREKLKEYDPRLANLLAEVFKNNDWRYTRSDRRKDAGHLAGFDSSKAPRFAWPKELLEWTERNTGNGVIRGKAGTSEIVIATSSRFAGAIHSLTWNGKEFLDSADHGRLLQSAANFDGGAKFVPETFNPTEAGSRADGSGERSSSQLYRYEARGNRLQSITQMAFWLAPRERTPDGQPARNDKVLSEHRLSKQVQIGYKDLPHVVDYRVTFTVPEGEKHHYAQFEALTGYMPPEFSRFLKYDASSGELKTLDDGVAQPGEQALPVVFATESGSHAMGIFSPDQPSPGYEGAGYGRFRFKTEKVNKWNCVFRVRNAQGVVPGNYSYRTFVVIGSVDDVRQSLAALTKEFKSADRK